MDNENPHVAQLKMIDKRLDLRYLPPAERYRLLEQRRYLERRAMLWKLLSDICKSKGFGYEDRHFA